MTIQRQSIKSGIASGNFGRAGTPLPSVRQSSGPDLSRLAQSLGVGIKSVVGEIQREDTAAAKAAVQEAIQKTQHSTPEERAQVLNTVRDQFDDQNLFMKIFTDENPAVKVMDEVTGMSKALETKNALLAASAQNKHLPLEEQQEIQRKILEEASVFSKGISEGTHRAYLNSIHNAALQIDDQTTAAWNKKTESEAVAQISDTFYREANDLMSSLNQTTVEGMSSDLDTFQAGRDSIQNNLIGNKVNIAKRAQDMFNKILTRTRGNKEAAGAATVDMVTTLARQYHTPELLDVLHDKSVQGANKSPLGTFYSKQIQQAKTSIHDGIVRKKTSLEAKAQQQERQAAVADYNQTAMSLSAKHDEWKDDPENTELLNQYTQALDEEEAHLRINQESYIGREDDYIQKDKLIKYHKALVTGIVGSVSHPTLFADMQKSLAMGALTQDRIIANSHLLSTAQKSQLDVGLRDYLAQQSSDAKKSYNFEVAQQAMTAVDSGLTFSQDSKAFGAAYKDHIEATSPEVATEVSKALNTDFEAIATNALTEWKARTGKWGVLTQEDMTQAQAYVDSRLKPHKDKYDKATQKVVQDREKRKAQQDKDVMKIIDLGSSKDDLNSDQVKYVIENFDTIKLAAKDKVQAKDTMNAALRSGIRHEVAKGKTRGILDRSIISILSQNPLDLGNPEEAKEFTEILAAGLEDLTVKRTVVRKEGEFGDPVFLREENLGDYIRALGAFDSSTYERLVEDFDQQGLTLKDSAVLDTIRSISASRTK